MTEIATILQRLYKTNHPPIEKLFPDPESAEYSGFNFRLSGKQIKFRKSKITPKKNGQFVTLWKRGIDGTTEPFTSDDDLDFCMIATEENGQYGFFFFPKYVLVQNGILKSHNKPGKRGFRVYPSWTTAQSSQAQKTQSWQGKYFIALCSNTDYLQKFNAILIDCWSEWAPPSPDYNILDKREPDRKFTT